MQYRRQSSRWLGDSLLGVHESPSSRSFMYTKKSAFWNCWKTQISISTRKSLLFWRPFWIRAKTSIFYASDFAFIAISIPNYIQNHEIIKIWCLLKTVFSFLSISPERDNFSIRRLKLPVKNMVATEFLWGNSSNLKIYHIRFDKHDFGESWGFIL